VVDFNYMCGIVGYIGKKTVLPILVNGLRRLEYRGYDSAGVAVIENDKIERIRAVGKVDNLAEKLKGKIFTSTIGIAHTRWATHGGVTEENAHPHVAMDGKLVVVHNGIIENYRQIRKSLEGKVKFASDTDTEILGHLIASHYKGDIRQAVSTALSHVQGTYGLVVMHADHPDRLVAARKGSQANIGVGSLAT
jgi:glucosamine--fructose-6-phosphate aminotransferase (isomerizing)